MSVSNNQAITTLSQLNIDRGQLRAVFNYLFGSITVKEFRQSVDSGISLKRRFDTSGYILKNCRLYAYAAHTSRAAKGKVTVKSSDFQVTMEDAKFLRTLDLTHIPVEYNAFSLAEYDTLIQTLMTSQELQSNIGKFVNRKMRFIYRNSEKSYNDLCSTLMAEALYGVYRAYPRYKTYNHMLNIAKTCLRNHGHTIIRQHGLQASRCTYVSMTDITPEVLETIAPRTRTEVCTDDPSHHYLYTKLLNETRHMSDKGRTFIRLSFGVYDEEFSTYLGVPNDQAMGSMHPTLYQSRVRRFLGISPAQVGQFYGVIRERTGISL